MDSFFFFFPYILCCSETLIFAEILALESKSTRITDLVGERKKEVHLTLNAYMAFMYYNYYFDIPDYTLGSLGTVLRSPPTLFTSCQHL